ncbi:MAG: M23 family metallopeptidase [Pseudomonadota bacterium]|nr:M23 family metallopeptidase [Pseudomonadota bacterium]
MLKRLALTLLLVAPALPAAGFELGLPIRCELGHDCFIQQYVDVDPGPGARDFTCGPLSYDGHKGTDFRIVDLEQMRRGVPVTASAAGTVRGIRDGIDDVDVTTLPPGAMKGRECGNGVAIVHDDGWETQYCHLRKGSVTVRTGDRVAAGDVLGMVGMSGQAQFPHVHISVRRNGENIDPYRGDGAGESCGGSYAGLWRKDVQGLVAYRPGGLMAVGFNDRQFDSSLAEDGRAALASVDRAATALVLWYRIYGIREGDVVRMRIVAPDGTEFFTTDRPPNPRNQAQVFAFAGRRSPDGGLQAGTYTGSVTMIRNGLPYDRRDTSVVVR